VGRLVRKPIYGFAAIEGFLRKVHRPRVHAGSVGSSTSVVSRLGVRLSTSARQFLLSSRWARTAIEPITVKSLAMDVNDMRY
jgi:hypothetical protein